MALIANSDLLNVTDYFANAYRLMKPALGLSTGSAVAGTVRNTLALCTTYINALSDSQQKADLQQSGGLVGATVYLTANRLAMQLRMVIQDINSHCALRGPAVNASIKSLVSYLLYYNGGGGGNKFSALIDKNFADLWAAIYGAGVGLALPYPTVSFEPVSSIWGQSPEAGAAYANGFVSATVGGTGNPGFTINNALYAEQQPIAVVTTNIAGGTGVIQVTAGGTDDQGNSATWGPVTLTGGNNPVAALTQQTISSGAITAQTRVTVTVGSTAGIVAGSILICNKGKPDQEWIVVESVPSGTTLMASFNKSHGASATLDGNTSTSMGNASTGAGRRCRAISLLSFTVNGHNAGIVEIDGSIPRLPI